MIHAVKLYWFPLLVTFIAAVSLYDTFLIVRFSESIVAMEENPVGQWLLALGHGEVGLFVRAKLAGTLTVVTILTAMNHYQSRRVVPVTTSIAAYQTALLSYLTFA